MTRLLLLASAMPAAGVSRPGGPSAKSFHRTGPSSTHQHDTSEGKPMVDATQLAAEDSWPVDDDALMLAMAEHHEDTAAALRHVVTARALLRLVLPGGGSR